MKYFLQLSYNGKNFHGWQIQQNAHSVQAEVNQALQKLLGKPVETIGCCRTDTGVHARKFFAHFSAGEIADGKDFVYHLNCLLPFEIAIQSLYPVHESANARFDATSRTYRYYIHQSKNAFLNDTSYFFPTALDIELMHNAAQVLLEYEDFNCFTKTRTQMKSTLCEIKSTKWSEQNGQLIFEITANRFLRNMVRAVVGTLLEIGGKYLTKDDLRRIIENKNRSDAGASVPGHGLFLENVTYPFIDPS